MAGEMADVGLHPKVLFFLILRDLCGGDARVSEQLGDHIDAGPGVGDVAAGRVSQLVRPDGCRDRLHRTIDESLRALPRNDFDFLWLIDVPPYDPANVADLQPVWRGPGSILYRLH